MALPALKMLTYDDYLRLERDSDVRHEFLEGYAVAMAGGTMRHSALKLNLGHFATQSTWGQRCRPFDSDWKIFIPETGLATYPDLSIICGDPETPPGDRNAATNPVLLAEVLSPSTERWDRGDKFSHYRKLASLRHYLLLTVDAPRVEHYMRQDGNAWLLNTYGPGDVLVIEDVGLTLNIDALYSNLPPLDDADTLPLSYESERPTPNKDPTRGER